MTKWITKNSLPDVVIKEISNRLPKDVPGRLSTRNDVLAGLIAEGMSGKDFGILTAKWMFSQMEALLGPQRLRTPWAEFLEEEVRLQHDINVTNDKLGTSSTKEMVLEERSQE